MLRSTSLLLSSGQHDSVCVTHLRQRHLCTQSVSAATLLEENKEDSELLFPDPRAMEMLPNVQGHPISNTEHACPGQGLSVKVKQTRYPCPSVNAGPELDGSTEKQPGTLT